MSKPLYLILDRCSASGASLSIHEVAKLCLTIPKDAHMNIVSPLIEIRKSNSCEVVTH